MRHIHALMALTLGCVLVVAGCHSDDGTGLSADQEKMTNNINAWAKASGGDWNKLTADQKQSMIKSVGSESSAKMVLQYSNHRPDPIAAGPPAGWKPGGPPPSHGAPPTGAQ